MEQKDSLFSPFVVFGASKSGTTWLQRLLDSHPDIRCHFQIPIFPLKDKSLWVRTRPYRVGSKSPFKGVFEDAASEDRYQRIHDLFYNMDILQPNYYSDWVKGYSSETEDGLKDIYRRTIGGAIEAAIKDLPGKKIYGTKAYTNLGLFFDTFPNGKVVQIVRDGRDVCVSKRFHLLRMGVFYPGEENAVVLKLLTRLPLGQRVLFVLQNRFGVFNASKFASPGTDRPLFTPGSLQKMALEWKKVNRYIHSYRQLYPDKFIGIKFEELKIEPVAALRRVFAFLEVDASDSLLDKIIEKNSFKRLKKAKDGFFRNGKAGDWRNYFTTDDIKRFKTIAGDMLIELEYEKLDNWN